MRTLLKKAMQATGYRIVRANADFPVDLTQVTDNPLEAGYRAGGKSFLIHADVSRCRNLWWFPLDSKHNPFTRTITEYRNATCRTYEDSYLHRFYESFQPKCVAEIFGFEGPADPRLRDMPAKALVFPWDRGDMVRRLKFRHNYALVENTSRGRKLSGEHGILWLGPVSREKGELEFRNLMRIAGSVESNGYARSGKPDGDISAFVLLRDADFRYQIAKGNHRSSVLPALGHSSIPVRIQGTSIARFIYREQAEYWPNVKSGLYTRQQALQIFDTVFDGMDPVA